MFAQCDSEGNQYLLSAGIVDHRKDQSAVENEDMYINMDRTCNHGKAQRDGACALNGRMAEHPGNALQI
jgi:hypothetical protein